MPKLSDSEVPRTGKVKNTHSFNLPPAPATPSSGSSKGKKVAREQRADGVGWETYSCETFSCSDNSNNSAAANSYRKTSNPILRTTILTTLQVPPFFPGEWVTFTLSTYHVQKELIPRDQAVAAELTEFLGKVESYNPETGMIILSSRGCQVMGHFDQPQNPVGKVTKRDLDWKITRIQSAETSATKRRIQKDWLQKVKQNLAAARHLSELALLNGGSIAELKTVKVTTAKVKTS